MRKLRLLFRVYLYAFLSMALVFATATEVARAGSLTALTTYPSTSESGATSVSYSINFTTATTDNIKQVSMRFATQSGGTTKPANMSLAGAVLDSTSNLGAGWSLDTSNSSSGLIFITRASASSVAASTSATINLDGITNPQLRDCDSLSVQLHEDCYVGITTYSDDGSTTVDSGNIAFQITEDPVLTVRVEGVASGQTHNGITTSTTSTDTSLPFGSIGDGQVKYAAHKLTITTNAPAGYTITAKLESSIIGNYNSGVVHPFGATNATWTTPQSWTTPDGNTPNNNTGWFGANTTDTRVSGWSGSTTGKFGPISTVARPVARSTAPDRAGTVVYVSYALGVNGLQPADVYTGAIVYDVVAGY